LVDILLFKVKFFKDKLQIIEIDGQG
jgi:hypothetical protein